MSRARAARLERARTPFVAERRRQPDVDDRDVGLLGDDASERVPSSTAATTSKPLSRSRRARPSRRSARSSAITTRTAAPPHGGRAAVRALDAERPVERARRAGEPGQAVAGRIGAAAAVVHDLGDEHVPFERRPGSRCAPRRVLDRVRERLGDDEVRGRLDGRRRPLAHVHRDSVDRHRAAPASASIAASSPRSVRIGGWMPRARSRSSSSASSRRSAPRRAARGAALGIRLELLLGHAEAHPERDEPRLRAVVEVALDPAELGLLDVDRAGARVVSSSSIRWCVPPRRRPRRGSRRARARAPARSARSSRAS